METSTDNFQYWFLLDWTDDIHGGDELFSGLIEAKLQDAVVQLGTARRRQSVEERLTRLDEDLGSLGVVPGDTGVADGSYARPRMPASLSSTVPL